MIKTKSDYTKGNDIEKKRNVSVIENKLIDDQIKSDNQKAKSRKKERKYRM